MANNYCQTSTQYDFINKEQRIKAEAIMEDFGKAWAVEEDMGEEGETYFPFQFELEETGIWFYGDEYADVDRMAELIRAFQIEFKAEKPFVFSYSCTCSKMRLDEFSGGTIVVMPNGKIIFSNNERDMIEEAENPLDNFEKLVVNEIALKVLNNRDILSHFSDDVDVSDKVLNSIHAKLELIMNKDELGN